MSLISGAAAVHRRPLLRLLRPPRKSRQRVQQLLRQMQAPHQPRRQVQMPAKPSVKLPERVLNSDIIKKYLLTGLLIWVPLGITLWVLALVVGLMDQTLMLLPDALHPRVWLGVHIPGLGVILTLAVLLGTGVLAANYFGAWLFKAGDWVLSRIPLFKIVYNSVKQVSDTLLSSSGKAFTRSVLVPYPHPGVWVLGFVTGTPPPSLLENLNDQGPLVSVYVPTSPSPASGYVIMVPEKLLRPSGLSVDEALKYIVSLGVVTPSDDVLDQPIKKDLHS